MEENVLAFHDIDDESGIQQVTLNLALLYPDRKQRELFEARFCEFRKSHPAHSKIFKRSGDKITYQTECIIPTERDQRPPLLLVFGNPASHSVDSGMFFAYEGKKGKEREHRLWEVLHKAGILSFSWIIGGESIEELNRRRKKELYDLSYQTPFLIGLAVYYTMPSPASGRWSGVKGLGSLFGTQTLAKICECEKDRIARIIRSFVSHKGAVFVFQKDAYLAIKSSESPDYGSDEAKSGRLIGNCQCDSNVRLFCLPKTGLLRAYWHLLHGFSDQILKVG